MSQHPLPVLTDVNAGANETGIGTGETLEALVERSHQARLITRIYHKLDELTERKV
jgi:hypothetical protein